MNDNNGLLQRLSDSGVEFVIVGGIAAVLHGSSTVTRDLDVCAELSSENLQKPRRASLKNLYLQTDLGALDLLGYITGVGAPDEVRDSAIEVELFGRRVKVIGLEQLIKAKEAVGRPKDLLAATELRAILSKG